MLKKYQPESFKDYVLTADRVEKIESLTSFSLVKYYMKHETVPIGFVKNNKMLNRRRDGLSIMNNLDYFIRYVRVSTQSDDTTGTTPSTER